MATQDLQSKINRAIAALLISNPSTGCTWANTFPYPTSQLGVLPCTRIGGEQADGVTDAVPGNYRFGEIPIVLEDAAKVQPGNPDPESAKAAASTRFTNIWNLLTLSDDGGQTYDYMARLITQAGQNLATGPKAADNADMADFTILFWWPNGFSSPQKAEGKGGMLWMRGGSFEVVACNSALAG